MIQVALGWQEKSSEMPEIYRLIARCNREQGVWEAALQYYQKAIQLNKDPRVVVECLDMLIAQDQLTKVAAVIEEFKS